MNELKKTLLDAFERLSKQHEADMKQLEDQISHLQQQVQAFAVQQTQLIERYETVVQLLSKESSG